GAVEMWCIARREKKMSRTDTRGGPRSASRGSRMRANPVRGEWLFFFKQKTAYEIEKERRLLLGQIKARADAPFSLTFDTMLRDLYGAHPYALQNVGRRETIERFTRDDLLAHYRAIYHPERMVLAVSGEVPRDRVVRAAERLFGRMARATATPAEAVPAPSPKGNRRVITLPAQQAQIVVGYLVPSLRDPLYPAVRVLAATLGGG